MHSFAAALTILLGCINRKKVTFADIPGITGKGVTEVEKASLPLTRWLCDLGQVNFPLWASVSS